MQLARAPSEYAQLLADGETIDIEFKLVRDTFIFTNLLVILVDIRG
jgi:hypothetical protein